ncbi:hypothetical protein CLV43_105464 [Umezawaea tangerina]|uniref:Uncharacterized protein n=2 Tax=Umezawaea tangerina TaxID=84725 RepID=A0A2T0T7R1_9PSEU|nr:hypothetical protein CLV43_105464 [Umezawaea tangerina]
MPGGSGTSAGGFDGVVVNSSSTAFVPEGISVWELSVEKATKAKADSDYGKRLQGPNGEACAEVTYIQTILRPWTKAREWKNSRRQEGRWKDVRAYNLDSIHTWLESAPATTTWLADQLGKRVPGVISADDWWDNFWLPSTSVPLTTEIVLSGRDSASAELIDSLLPGRVITLGGGLRFDELRAFITAAVRTSTDTKSKSLRTRTLFVESIDSMSQLMRQNQPLVMVIADASWLSTVTVKAPHTVIVAALPGQTGAPDVPPVDSEAVTQQLVKVGVPDERAYVWGHLARRSLLALRRVLAVNQAQLTPGWAHSPSSAQRRLLLLGSWEGTNSNDRAIVTKMAGLAYDAVPDFVTSLTAASDIPFMGQFREQWHILAPEDSWTLLKTHITHDDLNLLRTTISEVFGTEQRVSFSVTLRRGLAQTLALLGAMGEDIRLPKGGTGKNFCRAIVAEFLASANNDPSYRHWSSLGDVLPLFAEAAPQEFIDALRRGLEGDEPLHRYMFQDVEPGEFGFTPSSTHNHVLWALQTIAWSEDHFLDVIEILAQLAAIDPGGQWSTRPNTTLQDMMSCWHPSTAASDSARRTGLRLIMRVQPEVGRHLLLALIPTGREIQSPTVKPEFRDWTRSVVVTRADIVSGVDYVVDMILDDLGSDINRHLALLTKFEALTPQRRVSFVEKLVALNSKATNDAVRGQIADAIRQKIARHREYADTQWALPESELTSLEQAGQTLAPTSTVWRSRWLFDSDVVELGDLSRRDDFASYETELSTRRADAVRAVIESGGVEAIAELTDHVSRPYFVGYFLLEQNSEFDQVMISWLREGQNRQQAARGYLRARLRCADDTIYDQLLSYAQDATAKAEILHVLGEPGKAWQKLSELDEDVKREYWAGFVYHGLGAEFSEVAHAAENLLDIGRIAAALDMIALYSNKVTSLEVAEIATRACEALLAQEISEPEMERLSAHDITSILSLLNLHKESLGTSRVAYIEWQLFPALGSHPQVSILHEALQEDPAFFAELVSRVYRATGEDRPTDEEDSPELQQRRILAERAYEVLNSWEQSPGIGVDGIVETELLNSWVNKAREYLRESGRPVTGDLMIGRALAYAPPDKGGLFPPRPIRDLLEDLRAKDIDRGLENGIVNLRGMTWRDMTHGGTQEWELAAGYRRDALKASEWPRTKKILTSLVEWYEDEARRQDDEAERVRRGLPD